MNKNRVVKLLELALIEEDRLYEQVWVKEALAEVLKEESGIVREEIQPETKTLPADPYPHVRFDKTTNGFTVVKKLNGKILGEIFQDVDHRWKFRREPNIYSFYYQEVFLFVDTLNKGEAKN